MYNQKIIDRIERNGEVICPLCDSRFASDEAFDLHRGEPTIEFIFVCIGAPAREAVGLVRERGLWSLAKQEGTD